MSTFFFFKDNHFDLSCQSKKGADEGLKSNHSSLNGGLKLNPLSLVKKDRQMKEQNERMNEKVSPRP